MPNIDPRVMTRPRLDALFEQLRRDELDDARPPRPEDYARAEQWFDREPVRDTRAW